MPDVYSPHRKIDNHFASLLKYYLLCVERPRPVGTNGSHLIKGDREFCFRLDNFDQRLDGFLLGCEPEYYTIVYFLGLYEMADIVSLGA